MTTENRASQKTKVADYLQVWGNSVSSVLQEVAHAPHTWQELTAPATQELLVLLKEGSICVRFEAAQHLSGNQGFVLSTKGARRLAQLLLMEPEDGASELNDDHKDALGELFRQFAGSAAASLKSLAGGEVGFKWVGLEALPGQAAAQTGMQWASPDIPTVTLLAVLSSELVNALSPATPPTAQAFELPPPTPASAASAKTRDPNLELLMDVELDVTLRFGERQMVLHDILDLAAGSVVELNQHVQDPVELLVGTKVIARGEVVVVDGSYGLRVTEILSPMERIESLRS